MREKCRCLPIDGSATLTIDASITTMNCAIARSNSARFFARGVSSGSVRWGSVRVSVVISKADLRSGWIDDSEPDRGQRPGDTSSLDPIDQRLSATTNRGRDASTARQAREPLRRVGHCSTPLIQAMTDHLGLADHMRSRPSTRSGSRSGCDRCGAFAPWRERALRPSAIAAPSSRSIARRPSRCSRLRRNSSTRRSPEGGQLAVGTRWGASTGRPTALRGNAERDGLTSPTAGLRQPVVELYA